VRQLAETDIDFSMDLAPVASEVKTVSSTVLSRTLVVFHGVILLSVIIVMFLSIYT
jgi:hypothetical protein